ncbi:MAG: bifunctional protein HldE [Candidatus Tectimicrobiota bacterium]|nr:MAG: bifunctional protein HldE [Candidatus Tectomicrobia bacterium]
MARRACDKIQSLEGLARRLADHRARGDRIVHCHGVFDLLHIGHIRHLTRAKQYGDVLVVPVTPDVYVNKGPHRPAFTETLRAEALAALDCVDYVAINRWPTATEAIGLLRPHVYVKGAEYRDASQDRTGGMVAEAAAVAAVGGQVVFTDELTCSASHLLNRYLPTLPEEVREYLAAFSARYRPEQVLGYLERARHLKVLVVGEAIVDEYCYCEAIGKAAKAPMLALRPRRYETFAGGSAAVANQVAHFCDTVALVTTLGARDSRAAFLRAQLQRHIEPVFIYRQAAPTIVKRRFIDEDTFTKLFELYEMDDSPLEAASEAQLCAALTDLLPRYDVVLVTDFGHGMLSREAIDLLYSRAAFLAVNTQANAGNWGFHTISRYPGADYVSLAESELRLEARQRRGPLRDLVHDVAERLKWPRLAVTRSRRGCLGYSRDEGFVDVPAFAGPVVDRMGAGDAFFALTALCAAQGAPMEVLGVIGNAVGAQAVATVGHRTAVARVSLLRYLETLLK